MGYHEMQDILPALPMVVRKLCNLAYITNIYYLCVLEFQLCFVSARLYTQESQTLL